MLSDSANPRGNLFLQHNDPSQNSSPVLEATENVGCCLLKIPARSSDLNPIEIDFYLIEKKLREESLKKCFKRETFKQFVNRSKQIFIVFKPGVIKRTIESMWKQIDMVIKRKGAKTSN